MALGGVAVLLARALPLPAPAWRYTLADAGIALAALAPPLGVLVWMTQRPPPFFRSVLEFVNATVRPLFMGCSLIQLSALSLAAGVSEELLFRVVCQGGLTSKIGMVGAWLTASVLFGALHAVTLAYAILAGLIGAYLGALWIWTGNLLVPMFVHAVYDLLALLWILRGNRTNPPDGV